ncbi:MAG: transporter substrate-binding domain-containing protein [Desulfobacter sp.]|nr:MAG: transporter substrate-binding domain-containing protein [Desulfobacter sp.]
MAVILIAGAPVCSTARAESVTIACYQDYRPYSYVNKDGKVEGVLIDFWQMWGEKNKITVSFLPGRLTQSLERVKTGEADIMIGLFKSSERSNFLDFSNPMIDVHTNLYIREDLGIESIDQLTEKIPVGVIRDDFVVGHIKAGYPEMNIRTFPGSEAVVAAALSGKVKAYALDFPNAVFLLAEHDSMTKFKILKTLYTEKLRAAVAKGNDPLIAMINKGIKTISKEEVKELYAKWGITPPPMIVRYKDWIITAIVVLLAGCIGFGLYIFELKSRIRRLGVGRKKFDRDEWRQIIDQGENDWVEFKSSLRWNIKTEKADKIIEGVIVKTLSAFMNARGGTLFIGINDGGEAVGIEPDYKTFQKKPNRDGFMLKLSSLISHNFGRQSHKFITTDIQAFGGRDVCRITVKPSDRPVYIKEQGKEAFFIRAGASSVPLSMSEAHEYIRSRW